MASACLVIGSVPFARGWLGAGDVKLLAAVGAWVGLPLVPVLVLATAVAGGVVSAGMLVWGRGIVGRGDILTRPRSVDMGRCIACGACAEKCPKKIPDEFNEGLNQRKAAYVKYAQAVPLKYAIDRDHCIYFQKGKCRACEKFCPSHALDFEQKEQRRIIRTDSILLAPGLLMKDMPR